MGAITVFVLILAALWKVHAENEVNSYEKRNESISAYKGLSKRNYLIVFAVITLLLVAGMLNGGLKDVLIKAINICTECIGLG